MNRSYFSKARYMIGVSFKILARTPPRDLRTSTLNHSAGDVYLGFADAVDGHSVNQRCRAPEVNKSVLRFQCHLGAV